MESESIWDRLSRSERRSDEKNQRTKKISMTVAMLNILACIIGGYWYVIYYCRDWNIIKAGQGMRNGE